MAGERKAFPALESMSVGYVRGKGYQEKNSGKKGRPTVDTPFPGLDLPTEIS